MRAVRELHRGGRWVGLSAVIGLVVGLALGAVPFGGAPTSVAAPVLPTAGLAGVTAARAPAAAPSPLCSGICASSVSDASENWIPYVAGHSGSPGGRTAPAVAYDAHDGYLLLFGGCARHACPLGDTWKYQDGVWVNITTDLPVAPSARYGAIMVYDAQLGAVVLFGGIGTNGTLNDTWTFAGGGWTPLVTVGSPPARAFAQAAYDGALGAVLLFGGNSSTGRPLNDTWTLQSGTWTNRTATAGTAPAARADGALAFDPADAENVLFGGTGACGTSCNDTWTYSQAGWSNVTPTVGVAPPGRSGADMAFDPGIDRVVLFGGQGSAVLSDTWSFHAGAWTDLTLNLTRTPPARSQAGADFDAHDGYFVIYGGHDGTLLRTGTWILTSPLAAGIRANSTRLAPGAAATFSAVVSGGLSPYSFAWDFGDGSPTTNGSVAAHTYSAAGTYVVALLATDSLGGQLAVDLPVTVAYPPLSVLLTFTPDPPRAGETISFVASAQGGAPPYTYAWSGATAGCRPAANPATLGCPSVAAGTFAIAVTATDASGRSAAAVLNVSVGGATSPVPVANSTPPATSPVSSGASPAGTSSAGALVLLPALAAVGVAGGVGYATFRSAARRPPPTPRPLCYAVPLWSETPEEYRPEDEIPVPR